MKPEKQSALLTLLQAKKESLEEIDGAYDYFKRHSKRINHNFDVVDIVGTGGDRSKSFNISTLSSIIIASTGVQVAKHGGSSASSQFGSFDTISSLGIEPVSNEELFKTHIKHNNYVYLWAPMFNSALKKFGQLRKNMEIPTMFNILGPLLNPALPKRFVIGVYREDLLKKMASIMIRQGVVHALIIHGEDGLDEMSISGPTKILELSGSDAREYKVIPEDAGLKRADLSCIQVRSIDESKDVFIGVLRGEIRDARRDVVLLNSASGLYVSGKVNTLREGVLLAAEAIDSGISLNLYEKLKRLSYE
jgi:anthranilate phosphoribosyltransferase